MSAIEKGEERERGKMKREREKKYEEKEERIERERERVGEIVTVYEERHTHT